MCQANQKVPDRPTMPDEDIRRLRAVLILEEALETVRELGFSVILNQSYDMTDKKEFEEFFAFVSNGKENLEGIADGCADTIVVTTGTLSACGIADDSLQNEVDVNNLAKFKHVCPNCGGDITDSVEHHRVRDGVKGHLMCPACQHMWVSGYSRDDNKWVKSSTHKPPNIAEVLKEQTGVVEAKEV